jgi:hypothetical protein
MSLGKCLIKVSYSWLRYPLLKISSLKALISLSLGNSPVSSNQRTPSGIGSPPGIDAGPFF